MITEALLQIISAFLSLLFAPIGYAMAELFANLIPFLSTIESLLGIIIRAASYFFYGNDLSFALNVIPIVFGLRLSIGLTKFIINVTRGSGA